MREDRFVDQVIELLPKLHAFGSALCGDPARADDLVQDTFMRAWRSWRQFRPDSNMKAWLFTILARVYYSELRHRKFEVRDEDDQYAARLTVAPSFEAEMQLNELSHALERLPPRQLEALLLVCADELPYASAAEACGVAVGTIKSRIARARAQLANLD